MEADPPASTLSPPSPVKPTPRIVLSEAAKLVRAIEAGDFSNTERLERIGDARPDAARSAAIGRKGAAAPRIARLRPVRA